MQRGPSTPLRAGRYRVVWNGTVRTNPAPGEPIGRVLACYNECRTIVASAPLQVSPEGQAAGVLMELHVPLPKDVDDFECRLFVNRGVILRLDRVTLTDDAATN